ncbi:MAG: histidine kinase dimerization/phospho-acceptor domain-containing protein [Armatimonadota bacterium]|nr:hypothetical protein [bacterium]MCS7308714.1 hypothetical protein [Armatimonadota bacterium]MDW8103599.1 histidine kinase dimerization/phospho-acceptor domain-containing protein [Armatimonadota bacterium]MDW8289209.1 histidine kinase dimerization/phospho-acceptor domain-containing protein [Armatimonadota bacterium]
MPGNVSGTPARWHEVRNAVLTRLRHDIRAPLTAIVGFAELLGDEDLTPQQQGYVQRILEATDRIVEILNEVQQLLQGVEHHPSGM